MGPSPSCALAGAGLPRLRGGAGCGVVSGGARVWTTMWRSEGLGEGGLGGGVLPRPPRARVGAAGSAVPAPGGWVVGRAAWLPLGQAGCAGLAGRSCVVPSASTSMRSEVMRSTRARRASRVCAPISRLILPAARALLVFSPRCPGKWHRGVHPRLPWIQLDTGACRAALAPIPSSWRRLSACPGALDASSAIPACSMHQRCRTRFHCQWTMSVRSP